MATKIGLEGDHLNSLVSPLTRYNYAFSSLLLVFSLLGVFDNAVFVADSYYDAIYASPLTTADTSLFRLPFQNLTFPIDIDLDPVEDRIYWTDSSRGTIMRSFTDGKDQKTIRSGAARPYGMALDLAARNVYWINRDDLTIEVSNLNGKNSKVLVFNLLSQPYDLIVDTTKG